MKNVSPFVGGIGAGVGLISLLAATLRWKSGPVGGLTFREAQETRARRNCQRAERLAQLSPDYLDACRAAGL